MVLLKGTKLPLVNFLQNLNKLAELVRGKLPKLSRNIIGALITIDVHARDIVTQMVNNKVCILKNCNTETVDFVSIIIG